MSAELCRHRGALPVFRRHRTQESTSIAELRSFLEGRTQAPSFVKGEPIAAVEGHIFDIMPNLGPTQPYRPPAIRTRPRLAERRGVVVKTLIENPELPVTPAWIAFMERNFQRILRFAHTAINKGRQIDPAFR